MSDSRRVLLLVSSSAWTIEDSIRGGSIRPTSVYRPMSLGIFVRQKSKDDGSSFGNSRWRTSAVGTTTAMPVPVGRLLDAEPLSDARTGGG